MNTGCTFTKEKGREAAECARRVMLREAASLQAAGQAIDGHCLENASFYLRGFFYSTLRKNGSAAAIGCRTAFAAEYPQPAAIRAFSYGLEAGLAFLNLELPDGPAFGQIVGAVRHKRARRYPSAQPS